MKVGNIMSSPAITIGRDARLDAVAKIMLKHGIGCVPVVDEHGQLAGLITKRDFIAHEKSIPFSTVRSPELLGQWLKAGVESIYEMAKNISVKEIATKYPVTLLEQDLVKTFLEKILTEGITHAPVMRDGNLVGVVAQQDLLKMMADQND